MQIKLWVRPSFLAWLWTLKLERLKMWFHLSFYDPENVFSNSVSHYDSGGFISTKCFHFSLPEFEPFQLLLFCLVPAVWSGSEGKRWCHKTVVGFVCLCCQAAFKGKARRNGKFLFDKKINTALAFMWKDLRTNLLINNTYTLIVVY